MNLIRRCPGSKTNYAGYLAYLTFTVMSFALLTGCYESTVPLAPREQAALDASFFGLWRLADQEDDQTSTHMWIQPYDAHSYAVEFCCADSLNGRGEADLLRAHSTRIDSVAFANVQRLEADDESYLFFRYDFSDEGILTLRPVARCLFADTAFSTSAALYGFVQAHLEDERLYLDEPLVFKKADD